MKILLVCPVTSTTCERSFSKLRRLKTWLRNTLGQEKLNSNTDCNIHKNILMNVDLESILNTFVQRSAVRRNMFETYFTILIDVVTIHVQAYCNIFKIVVCDLSSTNNQPIMALNMIKERHWMPVLVGTEQSYSTCVQSDWREDCKQSQKVCL